MLSSVAIDGNDVCEPRRVRATRRGPASHIRMVAILDVPAAAFLDDGEVVELERKRLNTQEYGKSHLLHLSLHVAVDDEEWNVAAEKSVHRQLIVEAKSRLRFLQLFGRL